MLVRFPLGYNRGADGIFQAKRGERDVRFGVFWQVPGFVESSVPRKHWETIEEITLADELGFETAWLSESNFNPARPMSNPLMVAVAAAQHTRRIRFGTLAAQFPLHHPLHMATQVATCDILTNGRLDLGLGGRWGSPAGQAVGHRADITSEESRARVAEGIELMKLAWTQERVTFEGQYWSVKDLATLPGPQQQPHPQLLLAANSDETYAYAAQLGIGVIGTTLSQPMPRMIDRLREFEEAKEIDAGDQPQPFCVSISFFVAETREKALKTMALNWSDDDVRPDVPAPDASTIGTSRHSFASGVRDWQVWDFDEATRHSVYDDPAGCIERLGQLQEHLPNMDQCILEFNRRGRIPSEDIKESLRLFADEVMPELDSG